MKYDVKSRDKIEEFFKEKHEENVLVISITDIGLDCVENPNKQNVRMLQVQFDDAEVGESNTITPEQGHEIADFIEKNKDWAEHIICQCEAGVSRSAATCATIMKHLENDDMPIFTNPLYCPNMLVYSTILEAFVGKEEMQKMNKEIKDKFTINETTLED